MSDIHDTIDALRDQVNELEQELANVQEANSEWHELMNEHDVQYIQRLVRFDNNYDVDDVERVLDNYDLDDLKDAYDKIENYGEPQELAERVEELEECERKIEEYGDPQEMANELEELKEAVESDTPEAPADSELLAELKDDVSRLNGECIEKGEEIVNLRVDLAEKDNYIVVLKTEVARLDSELVRLSDELERTYGTVPYKALYDSTLTELCRLRLEKQEATAAFQTMHRLYFSQVSGYDDVPSSKPDAE